jgi:flagellar basal body-associated protein FliL
MDGGMIFLIILVIVLTLSTGYFGYQYYFHKKVSMMKSHELEVRDDPDFN